MGLGALDAYWNLVKHVRISMSLEGMWVRDILFGKSGNGYLKQNSHGRRGKFSMGMKMD
jgi:hypothetical protein